MTIQLAAVFMALLTAALLLEERSFRRRTRPAPKVTYRCLCCDGAPVVDDIHVHTALVHRPRTTAPEDRPEWSTNA
jgi:hypothetical protein